MNRQDQPVAHQAVAPQPGRAAAGVLLSHPHPTQGRHCRVSIDPAETRAEPEQGSPPFFFLSRLVAPSFLITWLHISPPEKKARMGTRASVQPQILIFQKPMHVHEKTGCKGGSHPTTFSSQVISHLLGGAVVCYSIWTVPSVQLSFCKSEVADLL